MLELIGYLVACSGAEEADARMTAWIPQQFLGRDDRADYAGIDDESIGADIAIDGIAIGKTAISDIFRSVRTGSPITIIYARENVPDHGIEEIAGAIPGFGVFDRGSQKCQSTGKGTRRA